MKKIYLESKINTPLLVFLQKVVYYCDKLIYRIDKIIENGEQESIGLPELDKLLQEEVQYLKHSIDQLKTDKRYSDEAVLNDALYAAVALVDELLISKNWFGKDFWQWNTLEKALFQTQEAGEKFYTKVDKILLDREYKYREVSYIYYLCLCTGFKGKLHEASKAEQLEKYKSDLYEFYKERFESVLKAGVPFIKYNTKTNRSGFLAMLSRYRWVSGLTAFCVLVFIAGIVASIFVWDEKQERLLLTLNSLVPPDPNENQEISDEHKKEQQKAKEEKEKNNKKKKPQKLKLPKQIKKPRIKIPGVR
jgi:type IV/VI secretion system ImpK/VasF family protein